MGGRKGEEEEEEQEQQEQEQEKKGQARRELMPCSGVMWR